MSKKLQTETILNELKGSSAFFQDRTKPTHQVRSGKSQVRSKPPIESQELQPQLNKQGNAAEKDEMTSQHDITTSQNDVTTSELDVEKLTIIVKSLAEIETSSYTTPVRTSKQEKEDIEDFIYLQLRKRGLQGRDVSVSKLMRYAIRYLIKVHPEEFTRAMKEALKKENELPI